MHVLKHVCEKEEVQSQLALKWPHLALNARGAQVVGIGRSKQPLWIKIANHFARCGVSTAAVNRNIVQNQRYHISRVNCRVSFPALA